MSDWTDLTKYVYGELKKKIPDVKFKFALKAAGQLKKDAEKAGKDPKAHFKSAMDTYVDMVKKLMK